MAGIPLFFMEKILIDEPMPDYKIEEMYDLNPHLDNLEDLVYEEMPHAFKPLLEKVFQKDKRTYIHSLESGAVMIDLLLRLAERGMNISRDLRQIVILGATLHDVGKTQDEDIIRLINLPRTLMTDEKTVVARHAELGEVHIEQCMAAESFSDNEKVVLSRVKQFARFHHSPEHCPDEDLRPFITLLHLMDQIVGRTDKNRPYLVTDQNFITLSDAAKEVLNDMREHGRHGPILGSSIGELCVFTIDSIGRLRAVDTMDQ